MDGVFGKFLIYPCATYDDYEEAMKNNGASKLEEFKKEKVLKTTAAGLVTVTNVSLAAVGSAIATSDTSSVSVPTIGQVATFGNLWGGSAKFVQTGDPSGSDGANGDFWFKYEA